MILVFKNDKPFSYLRQQYFIQDALTLKNRRESPFPGVQADGVFSLTH